MADRKDYKAITEELERQGWEVELTTRGHYKATPPNTTHGIVHFSHSDDHHALLNIIRDLRKRGFVWPPPAKKDIAVERRLEAASRPAAATDCEYLHCGEPGGCPIHSPGTPTPPETPEAKMERLFAELKDAKTYAALTEEHLMGCAKRLAEAQAAVEEATQERGKALSTMQRLKAEFDRAFEAAA